METYMERGAREDRQWRWNLRYFTLQAEHGCQECYRHATKRAIVEAIAVCQGATRKAQDIAHSLAETLG